MSGSCHLDRVLNVEIGVQCQILVIALLQILLGRGIHIDFSSQLKFAKIEFYGAFHL